MIFSPSLDSRIRSSFEREADTELLVNITSSIAVSAVAIWQHLSSAGVESWDDTASLNNFGEASKHVDLAAKGVIAANLEGLQDQIAIITEEDSGPPRIVKQTYALFVDPIDGSKHVHYQSPCGTFFSLAPLSKKQIPLSGYALYSYKLILVLALRDKLFICEYDPKSSSFSMTSEHYLMPTKGSIYSINDADFNEFPNSAKETIDQLRVSGYKARYNGVLVADLHRILLEGGVFLSPRLESGKTKTKKYFEALAITHIMQAAGGLTVHGVEWDPDVLLKSQTEELFGSTPFIFGSAMEIDGYKGSTE